MTVSRLVLFVLAPGTHLLDVAGPAQVFAAAAEFGVPYRLHYVAERAPLATHQGVVLDVATEWPMLRADDLLVVPGWQVGTAAVRQPFQATTLGRLVAHHDAGGTIISVCAGAFVLAAAGLLDHRRATTHHDVQGELARRHPRVRVVPDVLFVDSGQVLTSAGIASGSDLALHLLARDHGPAMASRVARALVLPLRRSGDAAQVSVMLRHRDHLCDVVHRVQDLIDERFDRTLPLADLAHRAGVSPRTLTRLFRRATGTTPLRYQQQVRVERAAQLVETGWTRERAAAQVGFADARMLRRLGGRQRPGPVAYPRRPGSDAGLRRPTVTG